jgi:spermidine synthase
MVRPERSRFLLATLVSLFVLSGASSLAYEVAWVKVLTLQLGASAWSIATVVASFMAGLGLGGAWGGRRATRMRNPLYAYALLELAISCFGFVSLPLLAWASDFAAGFQSWSGAPFAAVLCIRFLVCFGVLLIPTFLMGASLPVLVVGLSAEDTFGQRVALLYGANTLGAALGTIGAGVFGLVALGVSGTIQAAAILGLVVAAIAAALGRGWVADEKCANTAPASSWRLVGAFPIVALVTGCVAVFFQIAWTRLLVPVVGSSTYAFAIILTTVLLGIGVGGLVVTVPRVRSAPALFTLGVMVAAASLSALGGLSFVNRLPSWFSLLAAGTGSRTALLFLAQAAIAGALILVPTCCLGAALPVAIVGHRRCGEDSGRAVGSVYAMNTFGSILGSVLAGFVCLPWLGAVGSIWLAASAGLLFALVLVMVDRNASMGRRSITIVTAVALFGGLCVALPSVDMRELHRGVFRTVQAGATKDEVEGDLVYVEEGRSATVTVARGSNDTVLKVNGKADASAVRDLLTQCLLGYLPLALHPDPRDVCIVGYGSGATVYAVSTHPSVKKIDVAEIEAAVIGASGFFRSVNHDVLEDSRVNLFVEDGRTFLRYGKGQYDVIVSEPSNPWIAGISSLFTIEYYETIQRRLRPGGVFCQWIQFYELSDETLAVMLHTLASVFPHIAVFYQKGDLICVASDSPASGDLERYQTLFRAKSARRLLKKLEIHDAYDLFAGLFRSYPTNESHFRAAQRNTDDNLWLEYRAPIEMYQGAQAQVEWLPAEEYLANLVALFPGVTVREIARRSARRFARAYPELGDCVHQMAALFAPDPAAHDELAEYARQAAATALEREKNVLRLATVEQLLSAERQAEAIPILREVLEQEPSMGKARRALGLCLIQTGKLAEGARELIEAVRLYPEDYEAHTGLGWLVLRAGQADDAGHLRRAIDLNPNYVPAWRVLIEGFTREKKVFEARSALTEARERLTAASFTQLEKQLESSHADGSLAPGG